MRTLRMVLVAVLVLFCVVPLAMAAGNKELPVVPPVTSGEQYISPNGDGIKEEATLDFKVTLHVKSDEGYAPEFGLDISSQDGSVITSRVETEDSDINWFIALFRGYSEFELERSITWDGVGDDGAVVSDGRYKVTLWIKDANGNETRLDVDDFVVDTTVPSVVVGIPETPMLSPNGDSVLDLLPLEFQGGSQDADWELLVKNSGGRTVRTVTWLEGLPEGFKWDGTDDSAAPVEDGVYSLQLTGEDKAGNRVERSFSDILLDASAPEIRHTVVNANFSPNGDGVSDIAEIILEYGNPEAMLWSWSLTRGEVTLLSGSGEESLPERITITGTDDQGGPLQQGIYNLAYSATYNNGWRPVVEEQIVVDLSPPELDPHITNPIFSPNEDGLKDQTEIFFRPNEAVTWSGSILSQDGDVVVEASSDTASNIVVWNGTDQDGQVVPDGEYLAVGSFSDLAGNVTYAEPLPIVVDNRSLSLELISPPGFSPNGDGHSDSLVLDVDATLYDEVERWVLSFFDDEGTPLREFTGTESLPKTLSWDGTREAAESAGVPIPDGIYHAALQVRYQKGDLVEAETRRFYADVLPPKIDLRVTSNPFEMTEEGAQGELFISMIVENEQEVSEWQLDVYDESGSLLRNYTGKGNPSGDIIWNSSEGDSIDSTDTVTIALKVVDAGGNIAFKRTQLPLDILVFRKNGKLYLLVPNVIFGAYQHALDSAGPAMEKRNKDSLAKVVDILQRYPNYLLGLEAHALNIYTNEPSKANEEEILVPLTERRAETVRDALVELGLSEESITWEAYGGEVPVADVTDRAERWKNRRVEFAVEER